MIIMADLSFLCEQPGTLQAIDLLYEAQRKSRGYLGLSQAGNSCRRFLWYKHHNIPEKEPEGRILRLFQLGNLIEDQVIADLRACGFMVSQQQREVVFSQGEERLIGHIDGVIEGLVEAPVTPHLFECKSASKKKFEELQKLGSYRKWNEVYYWQVQFYMLGLKLKRAAAFVYCKDDSRLYMERIEIDREATIDRLRSIFEAIESEAEPERLCPRADHYAAKWCPFYQPCFFGNGVRQLRDNNKKLW